MNEELKPCPFCGYKITLEEGVCPVEDCVDDETGQWTFSGICCPSCAVFLPSAGEASSVYDGMKAWNTRHGDKDAILRECLAWVRHWQADVAGNLKPTPDSLAMMEAKLVAILQPVEAPEAAE